VLVLDGGMGRELARIGAPFRQPEWSALAMLESPAHVRRVHETYAAAGARVLTTNAYALVPFHIGEERFAADGRSLARLAGELARSVADAVPGSGRPLVAGSLPPVLGSYRPEVFDPVVARPIVEVLVEEQAPLVDVWLSETTSSIAEARLAREVLQEDGAGGAGERPWWVSFTVEDGMTDDAAPPTARLRSGETVAEAVRVAVDLGAAAVLFNCSQPEVMEGAVRVAVAEIGSAAVPIGVYANSFDLEHDDDEPAANESLHDLRRDLTPDVYVAFAERWVSAGATIVGGCCGVGPAHVAALSARWSDG
jgi:S-methylmethionine-dependent homocysteine/selenocysteine methylase